MKLFQNKQLWQVLFYLFVMVIVDNFCLQNLDSPNELVKWMTTWTKDPNLKLEYFRTGSVIVGFPSWADSLIWVVITLLLWITNRKKFLMLPLILYCAWITFWVGAAVAILSINLWNPHSGGAEVLLSDAFLLWVSNIVVFAIWYWILDHDNQLEHKKDNRHRVHFMFPQKMSPVPGWENWIPGFVDYLFMSFNTSTAFGVSETIVMTKKAKLLIMLQSVMSLVLFAMIAARAINIIR